MEEKIIDIIAGFHADLWLTAMKDGYITDREALKPLAKKIVSCIDEIKEEAYSNGSAMAIHQENKRHEKITTNQDIINHADRLYLNGVRHEYYCMGARHMRDNEIPLDMCSTVINKNEK